MGSTCLVLAAGHGTLKEALDAITDSALQSIDLEADEVGGGTSCASTTWRADYGRRLPVGGPLGIACAREEGRCRSQRTMVWVGLTHRHEFTRWHVLKAPANPHPHPHTPRPLLPLTGAVHRRQLCHVHQQQVCDGSTGLAWLLPHTRVAHPVRPLLCHCRPAACSMHMVDAAASPEDHLARHPSLHSNAFPTPPSPPGRTVLAFIRQHYSHAWLVWEHHPEDPEEEAEAGGTPGGGFTMRRKQG